MGSIRSKPSAIDVRQLGDASTTSPPGSCSATWPTPGSPAAPTRCCCWSTRRSTPPGGAPSRTNGQPDGTPVVDTDRGGKITWHGPGQLVGYPIIGLAEPLDVVNYVRRLEESLIKVCADLGLDTIRVDGRSGVWVPASAGRPDRKVAAIGVRVARATTLHGFALNCDCDLGAFAGHRAVRHHATPG